MWDVSDHDVFTLQPNHFEAIVTARQRSAPQYRTRTGNEQAAEYYLLGYSLSATERLKEGEEQFRKGLALTGIQDGYRHLLSFDLALTLGEMNRIEDAIAAARDAITTVPDDPGPWTFLSQLYLVSKQPNAKTLSRDAMKQATKLKADKTTERRLAVSIPSDFWVVPLAAARGWSLSP